MSASREYQRFIESKRLVSAPAGIPNPPELHASLFPFQRAVTTWALKRGRAALWLDTGLGKSVCAIEWSRVVSQATDGNVLILTPLAVAQQFVREGERVGVRVNLCREATDVMPGVNVTNYDRLDRFIGLPWAGVVCDESAILKDFTSATRNALIQGFRGVKFKLCCSATPAPNDHTEIGNHAEFLGVMTRLHMLAMFFVNGGEKTQDWQLKGHARSDFWRWVAEWAVAIRKPSDIGFDDSLYNLPPLNITTHVSDVNDAAQANAAGMLVGYRANTLTEQRAARRESLAGRVAAVAELVNASRDPWICWTDLNQESEDLAGLIPDCVEVRGSDKPEVKEDRINRFSSGGARVIVTKPSITGAGLNWQHCSDMAFVGLSHSWERFYQAIRRSYRFGQTKPVNVHIFTSTAELTVLESIMRKQEAADAMATGMLAHMRDAMLVGLGAQKAVAPVRAQKTKIEVPPWLQP